MKLSKYFTLEEMTRSQTAVSLGIDNTPPFKIIDNLTELAMRVDGVREHFGPLVPSNGYRSPAVNAAVGGAPNSAHMEGRAVDLFDPVATRALARFCLKNLALLDELGLWMEDPQWTPGWVHLQSRPIVGGPRVFRPHMGPPLAPKLIEQGGAA